MPRKRIVGVEEQAGGILKFFRTASIETAMVILALVGAVIKERKAAGQKIKASRGKQDSRTAEEKLAAGKKVATAVVERLATRPVSTATPLGTKKASLPKRKAKKRHRRTKAEMQAARVADSQPQLPDEGLVDQDEGEYDPSMESAEV